MYSWSNYIIKKAWVLALGFLVVCGAAIWLGLTRVDLQNIFSRAAVARMIDVDLSQKYQTFVAWEATPQAAQSHYGNEMLDYKTNQVFQKIKDQLISETVDLGINRVRLELKSGTENPVDYASMRISGAADRDTYRQHRYEIINDNSDPFDTKLDGFSFRELDDNIESVILPLKQKVEARGEKFYINLCYVDFGISEFEHYQNPEEFAELMQVVFQHTKSKYGFVPDAIEWLEPDNTPWSGALMGQAIKASIGRLGGIGYTPKYVVPSVTNINNAARYFGEIKNVLGESLTRQYISELSYHRYAGATPAVLGQLKDLAAGVGAGTAHLELIGADTRALLEDLTLANNIAWSQYTLAWPTSSGTDDGGKYFLIDDSNLTSPKLILGERTRYLKQYMKYIRPGAVRVKAESLDSALEPVAFIKDNLPVVVVKSSSEGQFLVRGLPSGQYGATYTSQAATLAGLPDVAVLADGVARVSIPQAGVVTLFGKTLAGSSDPPSGGDTYDRAPKIIAFQVSPSSITAGMEAKLAWEVEGARGVKILPDIGSVSSKGEVSVNPTSTSIYSLVADNPLGQTVLDVQVSVAPSLEEPPSDEVVPDLPGPSRLEVSFLEPKSGAEVKGEVRLSAKIITDKELKSVKLGLPGASLVERPLSKTPSYLWDTKSVNNGTQTVIWEVEDVDGKKARAEAVVVVNNVAQEVVSPQPPLADPPKVRTGTLAVQGATVYWLNQTHKIPFTNPAAFLGLGYNFSRVVSGLDLKLFKEPKTYMIQSPSEEHPWGSWLLFGDGTVYYSHEQGFVPVPSWDIFLNNGGTSDLLVSANPSDMGRFRSLPGMPLMQTSDPRVVY